MVELVGIEPTTSSLRTMRHHGSCTDFKSLEANYVPLRSENLSCDADVQMVRHHPPRSSSAFMSFEPNRPAEKISPKCSPVYPARSHRRRASPRQRGRPQPSHVYP